MIFFSVLGYKALILIGGIVITYMARTQLQMANLLTGIMGALPHFENNNQPVTPTQSLMPLIATTPTPTPTLLPVLNDFPEIDDLENDQ